MDKIKTYRELFPVTESKTFLNHAALSPYSKRITDVIDSIKDDYCNHGSEAWDKWNEGINETRGNLARLIKADTDEIAFVLNTTDAILFVVEGLDWKAGDNIVSVEDEFVANYYPWTTLQKEEVELRLAPQRDGTIEIEDLERLIDGRTRLLTISWVQYTNGFRVSLEELSKLCKERNILFAVDTIQGLGALELDLSKLDIDFVFCGGHKWMLSPVGTGFFFCRKRNLEKLRLRRFGWFSVDEPFDFKNKNQKPVNSAKRFEYSNKNHLGLAGFGESVKLLLEATPEKVEQHILDLTDYLYDSLKARGVKLLTHRGDGEKSGIVTFSAGQKSEELFNKLISKEIIVSFRNGNIRVSPHFYNNKSDIDTLIENIR